MIRVARWNERGYRVLGRVSRFSHGTPDISALCVPIDPQRHTELARGSRGQRESLEEGDDDADYADGRASLSFFFSCRRLPFLYASPPPRFSHSREKTTRHHCARFYRYLGRCLSAVRRRAATVPSIRVHAPAAIRRRRSRPGEAAAALLYRRDLVKSH